MRGCGATLGVIWGCVRGYIGGIPYGLFYRVTLDHLVRIDDWGAIFMRDGS